MLPSTETPHHLRTALARAGCSGDGPRPLPAARLLPGRTDTHRDPDWAIREILDAMMLDPAL